uniref:Zinc-ribbon domain protein n=1 Tax=Siphoviridae sp. ctDmR33 TaxID=2825389 RepID=A0A8S5UX63_9CAUD|nr:MAG TPA: zinc-ribbon domain protein [Siphoviridae sp. ctDmR33]
MSDYIERKDIRQWCEDNVLGAVFLDGMTTIKELIKYTDDLPAADVTPVKHGTWEKTNTDGFLRCSVCHDCYIEEIWLDGEKERWNFCPHCGAKMDGGDDDAESADNV